VTAHTLHAVRQAPGSRGAVLVVPGGGYRAMSTVEGLPVADRLIDRGVSCAVLSYSTAPSAHPVQLTEILVAIAELRERIPGPVAVMGFSAGGHLAGLAATARPDEIADAQQWTAARVRRPDLLVAGYPVVSFLRNPNIGTRLSLTAGDESIELARSLSVEVRVDPQTPPGFVWHAGDDAIVSVTHSLDLTAAMTAHGVPVELHVYPEGGHALGVADGWPAGGWIAACVAWLGRFGVGQS